jgi:rhamnosyltransferase
MIQAYRAAIQRDPGLVSLSPRIAGTGADSPAEVSVVGSAITSGNLVKVSLFDEVGLYDESFFIDCVDFDFCVRLRQAGRSIHRVSAAVMHHQLGTRREIPAFLRRYYSEHSPLRRYYSSRNTLYMMKRYLRRFPMFVLKLGAAHVVQLVLVAIYDPAPMRSYKAVARGVRDYFARRQGPYLERTR